ncbi:MAG: alpha/beta hydrolase [Snowella sp.]|nr:alpha/beta hydrolase [Snowella sp.]
MIDLFANRRDTFVNNIKISYWEWNPGKTPLLLLHGLADQGLVWGSLGDYLATDYHSIAPDLRGHGESSKPEIGYRFKDYLDDLDALTTHLGWSSCHVMGHSWGAKLACLWATQNSEKVRSLTLVDPFFMGTFPPIFKLTFPLLYRVLTFLKLTQSFPSYDAIADTAQKLPEYQGWSPLQQAVFEAGIEEKADGTWSSKFGRQTRDEVFNEVMAIAGLTQTLEIPSLLIKPTQGVNRWSWQLKPYQQYLPKLEIREMQGNHWAFLVNDAEFNPIVAKFLSQFT